MKVQLTPKSDTYLDLVTNHNKMKKLFTVDNVKNFVHEQEIRSRIYLLSQALALFNADTHQYYGDSINDTYHDDFLSITGLDNLLADTTDFITKMSVYVPGGEPNTTI